MGRSDLETSPGRGTEMRPGDELRAAQHTLESQIQELIVIFGAQTGVWISGVQVQYLGQPMGNPHSEADVIVRTTLET